MPKGDLDIRVPGADGLDATRRITAGPGLASIKVVILTTFDLDDYVFGALKAGASGFLLEGVEPATPGCSLRPTSSASGHPAR